MVLQGGVAVEWSVFVFWNMVFVLALTHFSVVQSMFQNIMRDCGGMDAIACLIHDTTMVCALHHNHNNHNDDDDDDDDDDNSYSDAFTSFTLPNALRRLDLSLQLLESLSFLSTDNQTHLGKWCRLGGYCSNTI